MTIKAPTIDHLLSGSTFEMLSPSTTLAQTLRVTGDAR